MQCAYVTGAEQGAVGAFEQSSLPVCGLVLFVLMFDDTARPLEMSWVLFRGSRIRN